MNKRILGLDSLRFLAIVMIVIYHCFTSALPGGFIAVEIFFALSGFLIGAKLLREFKKPISERPSGIRGFIRFTFSRIWKFVPALFFCMTLTLTLAFFASRDSSTALRSNSLYAATFSTNIMSIINGTSYESALIPNLFNHTWFLALELQVCIILYLVFAWLLCITSDRTKKRFIKLASVCLVISVLSFVLMGTYGWRFRLYDRAYFGPDTHIGAFFLGAVLAIFCSEAPKLSASSQKRPLWIIILALSLGSIIGLSTFVQYNSAKTFVIALPLTALLTCAAILAINKLRLETLPKWLKPIEYIGSISFYIYLYHWPLYILFIDLLGSIMPVGITPYIAIVVSLILAILTDKFIMPFFRKKTPVKYIIILLIPIIPILALIRAPEISSIEQSMIDNTEVEEEPIDNQSSQADYINATTISDTLTMDVMTYFGATSTFAKARPTSGSSNVVVNWTRITQGREAYSSPTLTASNIARLKNSSVMILGDSVTLGAKDTLESYGYFVDAKGSRNMTDALNLLAGYRAANGGNLPYTIVISLVTNKTTVNAQLLQNIVNTAGNGHQFIFVTGFCGNANCIAYTDGTPSNRTAINNTIKSFAASHSNVKVADWAAIALDNTGGDNTHLSAVGRTGYANLIRNTI